MDRSSLYIFFISLLIFCFLLITYFFLFASPCCTLRFFISYNLIIIPLFRVLSLHFFLLVLLPAHLLMYSINNPDRIHCNRNDFIALHNISKIWYLLWQCDVAIALVVPLNLRYEMW